MPRYPKRTRRQQVRHLLSAAGLTESSAAAELEIEETIVRQWFEGTATPPQWAILAFMALVDLRRRVE
jgi:hypothetical protein